MLSCLETGGMSCGAVLVAMTEFINTTQPPNGSKFTALTIQPFTEVPNEQNDAKAFCTAAAVEVNTGSKTTE
jgi:hypothetical protein